MTFRIKILLRAISVLTAIVPYIAYAQPDPEFKSLENQWFTGRCHMDWCSRFMITSSESMGSSRSGVLTLVHTRNRDEEYKRGYDKRATRVETSNGTTLVFCSKVKPAILSQVGNKWIASFLKPGEPEAMFGAIESAYNFYYATCHNTSRPVSDQLARRLGYRFEIGELPDPVELTSPFEVLKW